ncbi:hypothetical protein [Variovorax sp. PCZ-1]|uniref:hypothetical protein n=1 Tax=Variovorax sp. PCZ-1 TaxID=2835533 RepID=UPI001BD0EE9C|nr:hypothetical protein [Variovorax sp. PCZ-1]MBS7808597.1 hypothetical protein [Variovorax sp. PCZ-1]
MGGHKNRFKNEDNEVKTLKLLEGQVFVKNRISVGTIETITLDVGHRLSLGADAS